MKEFSSSRRGSSVVETALVLAVALMTFIGLIDIGSVIMRLQGLAERARAGARYGVVHTFDDAAIKNVVVYGNSAGAGSPLLGLTTSLVSATSASLGDEHIRIRVVIANYPFRFFTPFIAGLKTLPPIEVSLTAESQGATS